MCYVLTFVLTRFADPRLKNTVQVNNWGKSDQGEMKFVPVSEELNEFKLTGVNYCVKKQSRGN
jgi:hypothetical protein